MNKLAAALLALLDNPNARVFVRAVFVAALGAALSGGDPRMILVAAGQVALEYLTPANKSVGLRKAR